MKTKLEVPEKPSLRMRNVAMLSTIQEQTFRSRLERIQDWEALATQAAYDPENMAALCPISLRQLERFFKLHFGESPHCWAMRQRCARARELVQQGYSTKAVAAELNFTDVSNFCHAFKRVYRRPPQTFAVLFTKDLTCRVKREHSESK